MMPFLNVTDWSSWAPGLDSKENWLAWSRNELSLRNGNEIPTLSHLPPVAKRRVSQLSKMVLKVGHDVLLKRAPMKMIFCSQFSEVVQQFKITKQLIEDGEVRPANFSLSVFNTAASLLSIHEGIKESASVNISADHCLMNGLLSLIAYLNNHPDSSCLIIFADENLPEEYISLTDRFSPSFAFACVISISESDRSDKDTTSIEYSIGSSESVLDNPDHPLDFLALILAVDPSELILHQGGLSLQMKNLGNRTQ